MILKHSTDSLAGGGNTSGTDWSALMNTNLPQIKGLNLWASLHQHLHICKRQQSSQRSCRMSTLNTATLIPHSVRENYNRSSCEPCLHWGFKRLLHFTFQVTRVFITKELNRIIWQWESRNEQIAEQTCVKGNMNWSYSNIHHSPSSVRFSL